MEKNEIKKQKARQKSVAKFLKACGVKKADNQEEINAKTISYLKSLPAGQYSQVCLNDEQLSNAKFMLKVYHLIPALTFWIRPKNETLKSNFDFMVEYLRLDYNTRLAKQTGGFPLHKESHLIWTLELYKELFTNPIFIQKLEKEFKELNLIYIIRECYEFSYFEYDGMRKIEYRNLLLKLPPKLIIEQARNYGVEVLKILPRTFDFYTEVISAAIEKDGFTALEYLDPQLILDNKALIKKAYIYGGGHEALKEYLIDFLSPKTIKIDYNQVPPRKYTSTNGKKLNIQQKLLHDASIKEMLSNEKV